VVLSAFPEPGGSGLGKATDDAGDSIVEHVAGADDFQITEATYRAAVARRRRPSCYGKASGCCMT
jgi:hypothetical protein